MNIIIDLIRKPQCSILYNAFHFSLFTHVASFTKTTVLLCALVNCIQVGISCPNKANRPKISCNKNDGLFCLRHLKNQSGMLVIFENDFTLNSTQSISMIDDLCIAGNGSTITCTEKATGFRFTHVGNLFLEHFRVRNCGFTLSVTLYVPIWQVF